MVLLKNGRTGFSLLYVEDDQNIWNFIGMMISRRYPDARLIMAEDGAVGLAMFKEHKPDLVFTDISMPNLDGLSMASEIKTLDPETPIVIVSAHCIDQQCQLKLKEIGVEQFLSKPFKSELLFATIDNIVCRLTPHYPLME